MMSMIEANGGVFSGDPGERLAHLAEIGLRSCAMVHDLNNLLQIVTGNLELAARGPLGEKSATHLELARAGLDRCTRLTRRTLNRSERTQSDDILAMTPFLAGIAERLRGAAGEGIDFEMLVQDDGLTIAADEDAFENALLNLVLNARDAMEGRGRIRIRCHALLAPDQRRGERIWTSETVVVRVEDTGPGIAPEVLGRIFDRFFTTKATGTGLGLANVQAFVKAAKGTLAIDSRLGSGTAVSLAFPRTRHRIAPRPFMSDRHAG